MMPDDDDHKPTPSPAAPLLEDVAADIQKLFEEAHAAGAASDPEALPELPPDDEVAASPEVSARLMNEAVERHVDAITELAEYRRTHRRTQ